ncbi:hypothetical protein C8239_12965 [Paracidovorax avenae]|uniref:DUF4303 domain-containing protein n=1 Tax=Paracidovorax avenae TaxID=80867 RepID=UPI000D228C3B|nr:DUF4303 domain-containing protein [Paracidovorax avenae]AVS85549.1 hypothetical protein C8239_12965 [Paracidovorax avenae]AVS96404.1 hypothetical protein C8232_09160 [Paracidovorax avenae]AVT03234.1 hypothetical protein C8243_12590 [Paracidovorax avenae]
MPSGRPNPSSFDFAELADEIAAASRAALSEMSARCGDDPVRAFALYTDDGAMTVCPAMVTERQLHMLVDENPGDADFYRFSPTEWPMEGEGAEQAFGALCTRVRSHVMALEDEPEEDSTAFEAFSEELLETFVQVLERLRAEDPAFADPRLMLLVTVSDGDESASVLRDRIARLNGPDVQQQFGAWAATWAD